jgi:hypothetical protein
MSVIALVPSVRQRMFALQRTLEQNQPSPVTFDPGAFTNIILGSAAVVAAGTIWFLVRNRAAFTAASPQVDTI